MKIFKRKFFWGIPVALISFELFSGVFFGYLIGKFIGGKETGKMGKIKSLIFRVGNYKIHFHHWLYSSGILISFIVFNFSPPWPQFSFGFFGGLIAHGVISYSDWHQVLTKYKNN